MIKKLALEVQKLTMKLKNSYSSVQPIIQQKKLFYQIDTKCNFITKNNAKTQFHTLNIYLNLS